MVFLWPRTPERLEAKRPALDIHGRKYHRLFEREIMAFLASKGYRKETGRDLSKHVTDSILARAGYTSGDVMEWRNK
jgi:hypothetical protein